MRLKVVVLIAAVLLLGVALFVQSFRYPVASEPRPGGAYHTALATGVLDGRVNLDLIACFWLDGGGHRTAISWPYRYSAGGWPLPLSIYDADGVRLASVGQTVHIGGGLIGQDMRSIPGCSGFDQYWFAAPGPLT